MLIGGVVGARLYHVVHLNEYYTQNSSEVLRIWQGGLGIIGGLLGAGVAFIAIGLVERKKSGDFSFLWWLDVFCFFAPLAQSIGRWANYVNGELLPYAIYESICSIVLFGVFVLLKQKPRFSGFFFGAYLIGYGIIRFVLEFTKSDQWQLLGIYTAHIFSITFIITGLLVLRYGYNKEKS